MPTTVPADEHDWERIEAGHRAIDALQNIIGELRGLLNHDPAARNDLRQALGVLLGQDAPLLGIPVVVSHRADRRVTVTAEHRTIDGHTFGLVSLNEDWDTDEESKRDLESWLPLHPDHADRLADALHTAATAARTLTK